MVTKHLINKLGYEVTLVSEVGRIKHVMLKYMFVQNVVEEKQTTLAYVNTKLNKANLMTKCHTLEAHMKMKGCAMLGLKLSRDDGKLA